MNHLLNIRIRYLLVRHPDLGVPGLRAADVAGDELGLQAQRRVPDAAAIKAVRLRAPIMPPKKVKKKVKKNISTGIAHIQSTFNNTVVSITDVNGNTVAWSSAGSRGFKGSRKSTPFAAQLAAEEAARKAMEHGVRSVAAGLVGQPTLQVEVSGHTDAIGSAPYNLKLSQKRANAVVKYLTDKGIAADRLIPQGFGKTDFVATNATAEGRAQNRRVELVPIQ